MSEHCIKCNFPCEDGETLCNECKAEAKTMPKRRALRTAVFDYSSQLAKFVNECRIKQEDIQAILPGYRIFYWEDVNDR